MFVSKEVVVDAVMKEVIDGEQRLSYIPDAMIEVTINHMFERRLSQVTAACSRPVYKRLSRIKKESRQE